jgi:hypothetical protein
MNEMKCPKCASAMEEGFILERTKNFYNAAEWMAGNPPDGFTRWVQRLTGTTRGIPIRACRCMRCGYLEFYAR